MDCIACNEHQDICRGVCLRCYHEQHRDIDAGRTTDARLVADGKRLPVNGGKPPADRRERVAAGFCGFCPNRRKSWKFLCDRCADLHRERQRSKAQLRRLGKLQPVGC